MADAGTESPGTLEARGGEEAPGQGRAERRVFVVSDRTGITAEVLAHSLLSQFPRIHFHRTPIPYVDSPERAQAAAARIDQAAREDGAPPLVFTTFVEEPVKRIVTRANGVFFDFFDAFIGPLEQALGAPSAHMAGQAHALRDPESYSSRIGAIEYAMRCDDGARTEDYRSADLILTGVSRCGKTPTCLYLALHYGLKVANYPLVEEDLHSARLPPALLPVRDRVFGLTIDPARLHQIREERRPGSEYARLARCRREVAAGEALYRREHIPWIDVTTMSIEEICTTILDRKAIRRSYV